GHPCRDGRPLERGQDPREDPRKDPRKRDRQGRLNPRRRVARGIPGALLGHLSSLLLLVIISARRAPRPTRRRPKKHHWARILQGAGENGEGPVDGAVPPIAAGRLEATRAGGSARGVTPPPRTAMALVMRLLPLLLAAALSAMLASPLAAQQWP